MSEKSRKRRHKYPSCVKNASDYFSEYSSNSSIHGIKYIGEKKRTIIEKLWWSVAILASLCLCIVMIIKTYQKWELSPVIVSFARSPTPVWNIPFPAVTICSETKSKKTVFNFVDVYNRFQEQKTISTEEIAMLERISLTCDNHLHHSGSDIIDYETIDFLAKVAPTLDDIFYECRWMNEIRNCSQLFTPTLSEDGICFTFNMLDRDELYTNTVFINGEYLHHGTKSTNWTLEGGYPPNVGKNAYPKRAISAGKGAGLSVLLRSYAKDLDYVCRGPVQGFKVLLHHPAEVPRVSQQYFRAPLDQESIVAVKPDMMTTSDGLKDYDPHRRQCYFNSERQLRFYQVYTQQNCEVECLTNYTLKHCGCVSFHMPHDENTKLCSSGKTLCVHFASVALLMADISNKTDTQRRSSTGYQECDCLQACASLTYNSENSQADFAWYKAFEATNRNFQGLAGAHLTSITLFFKEMQFITSERNELYGPTDFLANCGGLLGLFMGFSFLSVVEIIYFLSLRLICNLKKYGPHYWSGSPELINDDSYVHNA